MANCQVVRPEYGSKVDLKVKGKQLSGVALILPLSQTDMLIGNDSLRLFRNVEVSYEADPEDVTEALHRAKISLKQDIAIPPQSSAPINVILQPDVTMEGKTWTAEINTVAFVTGNPDMTSQIRASVNNELPQDQQEAIHSVLLAHQQCFTGSSKDWGHCKLLSHKITTQDVRPIHQHPYPSAFKQRELLQQQVEGMLEDGVIEPSNSTWSSPVILV